MRGVVGEFHLVGGQANVLTVVGQCQHMRAPDGSLAVAAWGAPNVAGQLGWYSDMEAGLVLVADATLYDQHRLQAALNLPAAQYTVAELLLRAYQHWGKAMLAQLDGDYAFVVCDLRRRCVFAATDPMGMRSLFYRYRQGGCFTFSTHAETLAACAGLDSRIPESRLLEPLFNAEQLAHFEPDIPGIQRLLAAHLCEVDAAGVRLRQWWQPGEQRPELAENDVRGWVEGVRWHVSEAVRKRLADGVRAGVMFSGGLDSSAVLALASGMVPKDRLRAYSVLNRANLACPETRAIDRTFAAIDVASFCVDVADMQAYAEQARQTAAHAPRFVAGRNGFLPLFDQLAAASGIDVMMNGLDADAMFSYEDLIERQIRAGDYSHALRNARKQDRLGSMVWMQQAVRRARITAHVPPPVRQGIRRWRAWAGRGQRLRGALIQDEAVQRLHLLDRVEAYHALLRKTAPRSGTPSAAMLGPFTQDGVARFQTRSRHFGVEMRCPFLDRALIDFAAWIPLQLRLRNGHLKWILRKAMTPCLPHNVVWRGDKFHLGSHFDRVMLQPVLEQAVRDFNGSGPAIAPYVDRTRFLQQATHWQNGAIEAVWELKMLLLLELWLQHNADKVAWGC